jgi:hypothetical protein
MAIMTESIVVPTVTIRTHSPGIGGSFDGGLTVVDEPPEIAYVSDVKPKRHYNATSAAIAQCRHFTMKLEWTAANDSAELLGLGIQYDGPSMHY